MNSNDLPHRRTFLASGAAALALGAAKPLFAETAPVTTQPALDARSFGATGDGKTDDTRALQKALDAAGATQSSVFVPPGIYVCSTLKIPANTGLVSNPTWNYRNASAAIVRLIDSKATCLFDITGAFGATIHGLCLDGGHLGKNIHGVHLNKPDYGKTEDTFRIERCQIVNFTGDGVRLDRAWCFSIRSNMIANNRGNGIRLRGWDGFILDNWLSANTLAGFGAYEEHAAVTMTANRIEWNAGGGVVLHGGQQYNITGNYFDRSGGPGVSLIQQNGGPPNHMTITGNVFSRSGKREWRELAALEDCHLRVQNAKGVVVSGNSMGAGRDDDGKGAWSPGTAMILEKLTSCVVTNNVLHEASVKQLISDLGNHAGDTLIQNNPGSLKVIPT